MKFIVRSLLILLVLYGLVFALGDMFLVHEHASVWWAVGFSVGLIGIQYLVGPWFIERLLDIVWDDGATCFLRRIANSSRSSVPGEA